MNNQTEEINTLLSNKEYIDWIETFIIDKEEFTNLNTFPKISIYNQKNIKKLPLLYKGIDNYALSQNITPNFSGLGSYYTINFNNQTYKIGINIGKEVEYYCKKENNIENSIDYNDITNNYSKQNIKKLIKK